MRRALTCIVILVLGCAGCASPPGPEGRAEGAPDLEEARRRYELGLRVQGMRQDP